jgi:hypothetical protein
VRFLKPVQIIGLAKKNSAALWKTKALPLVIGVTLDIYFSVRGLSFSFFFFEVRVLQGFSAGRLFPLIASEQSSKIDIH